MPMVPRARSESIRQRIDRPLETPGSRRVLSRSDPMFKFLHAAAIHLDSPQRGLDRYEGAPVAECRGATRRALENLVDLAIREKVAFVLIVGDLYDGDWPDYNTGLFFGKVMSRLRDCGIPVYMIRGNHDAANRMTKDLRLLDNMRVLSTEQAETIVLEDCGVAVHGRSFPP